ncbi:hypothetical protein [Streptomyces kronopolitis]|uniref:hypothetical protein n=1 Tax=Streptomyces kronopolitis TaxID=1612435 RepID=UPI003D9725F4
MQRFAGKTLNTKQDQFGVTVQHSKIVLPVSTLASAAVAFGLGALMFAGTDAPADAAQTQAKPSVSTAPDVADTDAQDAADDAPMSASKAPATSPSSGKHAKTYTGSERVVTKPSTAKHAKPKATTKPKTAAGSKGPFADSQNDGKHLDDVVKSVLPGLNVPVHVPDQLLPFPGPGYTGKPTAPPVTIETQGDADKAAKSGFSADDVVSGANVVTDPDKPWFHFPTGVTEAPHEEPEPAALPEEPVASTPVVDTPVEVTTPPRNTGLTPGTRPKFF